jgi:hypothetical protein
MKIKFLMPLFALALLLTAAVATAQPVIEKGSPSMEWVAEKASPVKLEVKEYAHLDNAEFKAFVVSDSETDGSYADKLELAGLVALAIELLTAIESPPETVGFQKNLIRRDDGTIVTELQNFLLDYLYSDLSPEETKKMIRNGQLIFESKVYYVRAVIGGATLGAISGKQKVLDESALKGTALTNFNANAILPKGTNFAFSKLGVSYVADATGAGLSPKVLTGWTSVRGSVDKSLANAEINFTQSRRSLLRNFPVAPLLREAANTYASIGEIDYALEQPRIIKEAESFECEIDFGTNATPATAGTTIGVEIRFTGVEVTRQ